MNKEIKKYIKYVKKIIPIYSKDKKEFIQLLTQKIIEFSNEHDSCSYQDIVDEFGSPNEVAGSYIETLNSDEIIKKLNKKKIINIFISVIIILCIRPVVFKSSILPPICVTLQFIITIQSYNSSYGSHWKFIHIYT